MGAYAPFRSYLTTYQGRVASVQEAKQGEARRRRQSIYLCPTSFEHTHLIEAAQCVTSGWHHRPD
jgi:hypothetical protein